MSIVVYNLLDQFIPSVTTKKMASKQVVAKAVNWAALGSRVVPKHFAGFDELRTKFETTKGTLNNTPAAPAPIDWDHYKGVVKNSSLVEKLHAAYSELSVPYPEDDFSAAIEAEKAGKLQEDVELRTQLQASIVNTQAEMKKIEGMKAFEYMTLEEYHELFPEKAEALARMRDDEVVPPDSKPPGW